MSTTQRVHSVLKQYWGYESLRALQGEVIESALAGRDAVVVMPTGGGKSLCFQIPPLVDDSLTVVVSPLIALMKDQVDALRLLGVSASALNSTMSPEEARKTESELRRGSLRLLYISPERLLGGGLSLLEGANEGRGPNRFAIDEAHCISSWGHDFRKEYRELRKIKEAFPGMQVQAFTATAAPKVQKDIAIQLGLERPRLFVGVYDRPNLTYRVIRKENPLRTIAEAVARHPGQGVIIYCLSRKDTESLAAKLKKVKIRAEAYHAGLPSEVRSRLSEDFAREKLDVVAATVAFGMGIDRPDVRCVIHECMPKSLEGYQQETGRAGRDGLPSECILLYSPSDVVRLRSLTGTGDAGLDAHNFRLLEEMRRFALSTQCRHKTLSEHFGQHYQVPPDGCGACDSCLGGTIQVEGSGEIVQTILSSVVDLLNIGRGRSFGTRFLSNVLAGKKAKELEEKGGTQSQFYGALRSHSPERIAFWVGQLVDEGLLSITEGKFALIEITPRGREEAEKGSDFVLRESVSGVGTASSGKSRRARFVLGPDGDEGLAAEIRMWRKTTADARSVPPYMIFGDTTLAALAQARPTSMTSLEGIPGFGSRKVELFGRELTDLIADYSRRNGLKTDQFESPRAKDDKVESPEAPQPAKKKPKIVTLAEVRPLFEAFLSTHAVAEQVGCSSEKAWKKLAEWAEVTQPPTLDPWIPPDVQHKVERCIERVGLDLLRPIYEELEGQVSYEVIGVIRAWVRGRGA